MEALESHLHQSVNLHNLAKELALRSLPTIQMLEIWSRSLRISSPLEEPEALLAWESNSKYLMTTTAVLWIIKSSKKQSKSKCLAFLIKKSVLYLLLSIETETERLTMMNLLEFSEAQ